MSSSRITAAELAEHRNVDSYILRSKQVEDTKDMKVVKKYYDAKKIWIANGKETEVKKFLQARIAKVRPSERELGKLKTDVVKAYLDAEETMGVLCEDENVIKYRRAKEIKEKMAATEEVANWKRAKTAEKLCKEAGIDLGINSSKASNSSTQRRRDSHKNDDGKDQNRPTKAFESKTKESDIEPFPWSSEDDQSNIKRKGTGKLAEPDKPKRKTGGERPGLSRRSSSSSDDGRKNRSGGSEGKTRQARTTGSAGEKSAPVPIKTKKDPNSIYVPLRPREGSLHTRMENRSITMERRRLAKAEEDDNQ